MSIAMTTPIPVNVVCAIICDGQGRVLVAQRPPHKALGLKWEFPGGKVELGEAPEAALHREIREELGCEIAITEALPSYTHDYGATTIRLIPFQCRLVPADAVPHPTEHVGLAWLHPYELKLCDLADADRPLVEH